MYHTAVRLITIKVLIREVREHWKRQRHEALVRGVGAWSSMYT